MDTVFDITIVISGYDKRRIKEIKRTCMVEWNFREDDFVEEPCTNGKSQTIQASALGAISDGEDIDDIINRVERSIWRANNGKICHVEVTASVVTKASSQDAQAAA